VFGYFKALSRLSVIERTLIEHSKRLEEAETDWADMHSRCRKLMLRAERAASIAEGVHSGEAEATPIPEANGSETTAVGRLLTPRQMQIQQSILRKRAGL